MINLELQLIRNPIAVKKALTIDDLHENLVIENFQDWQPNLEMSAYYFLYVEGTPFAIMAFERFCSNGLMFHGGVFKDQRGLYTAEVLKEVMRQVKEIYGNKIFVTSICTKNIPAIKLVKKAGLKEKCVINNVALNGDIMILSE
jgi:hypothetical protein